MDKLFNSGWRLINLLPKNSGGDFFWSILNYRRVHGRFPNILNPSRFSEHLLRLKLSSEMRTGIRVEISDKELVKGYIQEKLGEGYTPKTLAVLRSKKEASNYIFPDTCVVKPTHASGRYILRLNGVPTINVDEVANWFSINHYNVQREPNYKNLQPKVIVEELLAESNSLGVRDYKVFCFNGIPFFILTVDERLSGSRTNYFSKDWRELPIKRLGYIRNEIPPERPKNLEEMLSISNQLSAGFAFLRVDLYNVNNRLYVGELTNIPAAGMSRFEPDLTDEIIGGLFYKTEVDWYSTSI